MKKIITVYTHRKSNRKFELVPEITMGDKVCLEDTETEEQKFYAPSTLKKNFWKEVKEVELPDPNPNTYEPGLRAALIRNCFYKLCKEGIVVKETASYIGINCGKKSVAQISFTKKRLAVSVNSDEFFSYIESFVEEHTAYSLAKKCFHKTAPAKYGWRMDFEIDVTDLENRDIEIIIETAIEARKAVI